MENAVARAVRLLGGPTKATFVCRVSVNTIHVWRRDGYVRDARAAVLLSRASGVPIEQLVGLNGSSPDGGSEVPRGPLSATSSAAASACSDSAAPERAAPLGTAPIGLAA